MNLWPWLAGTLAMFGWSIYLLVLSWGKWPDLLIDFGRELYIPWQLSEGRVLYQDIYFYYGPLSKYVYAFFFKVFSPSFNLLITINFIFLGVLAFLMYRALRSMASLQASWLALAFFFALFPFSQYVGVGNFNYICPYSHELVHGLILSFAVFVIFMRHLEVPSLGRVMMMGLLSGLIFLTKAEVFAAFFVAFLAGVFALAWKDKKIFRLSYLMSFLAAFLFPICLFLGYFSLKAGFVQACSIISLPYRAVIDSNVHLNAMYQRFSGLADLKMSLSLMGKDSLGYVVVFLLMILMGRLCAQRQWVWKVLAVVVLVVVCGVGVMWYVPAFEIFRPLSVICCVALVVCGSRFWRGGLSQENGRAYLGLFVFAVFATVLLMKIFFYGHIHHYGFVLAVPAVVLGVVLLFDEGVACGVRWGADKKMLEIFLIVVLMAVVYSYGQVNRYYYAHKNLSFGKGADAFLTYDPRVSGQGPGLAMALEYLRSTPKDATVAVLPEGVMLNYLSHRRNPTPFFEFAPGFFYMVPEDRVLLAFQSAPPDYIVMVDRDMSEYGFRFFGRDYAKVFWGWINEHYRTVRLIGGRAFSENKSWVWIGQRIAQKE